MVFKLLNFEIYKSDTYTTTKHVLVMLLMVVLAFVVMGVVIFLFIHVNPIKAYIALFEGSLSTRFFLGQTLLEAIPLLLVGLGMVICLRASLFNIGGNGYVLIGAMAATAVGLYFPGLPAPIGILFTIFCGAIAGALLSGFAGYLRTRFNIDVIYVTVMMNYIMVFFSNYILDRFWRDKLGNLWSACIADTCKWPNTTGFVISIIAVIWIYYLLFKTPYGFEIQAIGFNSVASLEKFKKAQTQKIIMIAMMIMGALSGIAGAGQVCGNQYRFSLDVNKNYGFRGILAAKLGLKNPIITVFSCFFLAILESGSINMQITTGVPSSFVDLIQGVILLCAFSADSIAYFSVRRRKIYV